MKKSSSIITWCLAIGLSFTAAVTFITGCASNDSDRSTGQYIDDKTLEYKVGSAVHGNSEYKLGGVDTKVYRGNVQLSGFVETEDQKAKAAEIAKNVEGVRNVENNITVKKSMNESPSTEQR